MPTRTTCKTMVGLTSLWVLGFFGVSLSPAQFTSDNVSLYAWLDLADLGGASSGNDCWGYVSDSGREYALMGVRNAMVVVEITDPANPVIVGDIPHTNTSWGDIKVFGHFAYVVNDNGGGGMDVVDLSDVDNGNVTLVQRVTEGGLSTSHDVAIDTDSAFLYLCGANLNGGRLIAYDLSNPADPTFAGQVSSSQGVNVHDAQVVTYTSGHYAGKQIAFASSGGTGLDIFDVTNKSNMFRLSRTTYPNLSYAHQGWLSEDRSYFYLNDELDGVNETVVFDVTDLENPVVVNAYNSGVPSIDHNLYVHDGFIYEAEYTSGLRIFCADDPINPVQVGWFDTYPENDGSGFDGAWSNYPFFPSGTVIISDINRGLFILDVTEALSAGTLIFTYPEGRPDLIDPQGGTAVRVEVVGTCGATAAPNTGLLHYDAGDGFVTTPLQPVSENVYDAIFPAIDCPSVVSYYISAETTSGVIKTDPPSAPDTTYTTISAVGETIVMEDNSESDPGWTTEILGATSGQWQRGVPIDDPQWPYDPAEDGDGSGRCWLTENVNNPNYPDPWNTDVDDGAVRLTSYLLDMTAGNIVLSYEYYLRLTVESPPVDRLLVEISSNGDAGPWTVIATHDTNGGLSWRHHQIVQAELEAAGVTLTSNMKIRYTANDATEQSIVEAGVDGLKISSLQCTPLGACCAANGTCSDLQPQADCIAAGGMYQGDATDCTSANCVPFGACCASDGSCADFQTQPDCDESAGLYQGDATDCESAGCAPFGACCLPDESCLNQITLSLCDTANGSYQGDGSTCPEVDCTIPTGGCCMSDFSCNENTTEDDCGAAGGTYLGDGSDCTNCSEEPAACCDLMTGDCVGDLGPSECVALGYEPQDPGTSCVSTECPIVQGACCLTDGNCSDELSIPACEAAGGIFQGKGVACVDVDCAPSTGACCLENGDCLEDRTDAECSADGGTFAGAGVDCLTADCPPPLPTGSCCVNNTICIEDITADDCQAAVGVYLGDDSDCTFCSTFTQACCAPITEECDEQLPAQCIAGGLEPQGPGTSCDEDGCPTVLGACCFDTGFCLDLDSEECSGLAGTWQGADTTCDNADCGVTGACCLSDESCLEVNAETCLVLNGTYAGDGTTCDNADCSVQTGACCLASGDCLDNHTSGACATGGGEYQGHGSTCASANCPTPEMACCFDTGFCLDLLDTDCSELGGAAQGPGTSCDDTECGITGACCLADDSCLEVNAETCVVLEGAYGGDGSTCDPDSCSVACPEDLNGDGEVGPFDLALVLGFWGPCEQPCEPGPPVTTCQTDLNGDCATGPFDLALILGFWGPCE